MRDLTIAENIKVLAGRRGLSLSDLARALGKSPQNFIQQINRDDFRISDIERISAVLGVRFEYDFVEKEMAAGAGPVE